MRVAVIGTGYVGLTNAVALSFLGHDVICVDVDEEKIRMLREGQMPIFEPHIEELAARSRGERLTFTTSAAEAVPSADVVVIAVGTPTGSDGAPNLAYVESAATAVGENLGSSFTVVVNKSTVPIGSANWVETLVRDAYERKHGAPVGDRFAVASNPEFLREGSALLDTLYPDRTIIGSDSGRAIDILRDLYGAITEQSFEPPACLPRPPGLTATDLVTTDVASAELIKYAANAFLSLKISFVNEIGELAEKVGADIAQVAAGLGRDARIGPRFLQAGLGWGGSCFGKDTAALVATGREYGLGMPIVRAARDVNTRQRERVIEKLQAELKILKGRTIGILGLAFKPGTDDLRDAPALDIARSLLERGAKVRVHDPVAMPRARRESPLTLEYCDLAEGVAVGADALLLATEWPEYAGLAWEELRKVMRTAILVDGRNALPEDRLKQAGFRYVAMGR